MCSTRLTPLFLVARTSVKSTLRIPELRLIEAAAGPASYALVSTSNLSVRSNPALESTVSLALHIRLV